MDNMAVLQKALSHLEKLYEERKRGVGEVTPIDWQPWNDSLADDVEFEVWCTSAPPEGDPARDEPPFDVIGRVHRGKQAVIDAFATDQIDIHNWEVKRPLEYFPNGDRIVVLLCERYTLDKRGDSPLPWNESAMVFDFRDGKIVRYLHIADMSGHVTAHTARATK